MKKIIIFVKRQFFRIKCIGRHVRLSPRCNIGVGSMFEGYNVVGENTAFSGQIGYGSYIADECFVCGRIGRFCSIAKDVKVIIGRHPTQKMVSTHPCFFSLRKQAGFTFAKEQEFEEFSYVSGTTIPLEIGNDVWIGQGVLLMSGITIGDGAIIAAGSVVTKDVPPYSIVGGVPAKEIRKRFSEKEIERLVEFEWWNKPISWIKNNATLFYDIEEFCKIVMKGDDDEYEG